ncbi:MAG: RagB/SusD family nutrient uptake outer membrane protein [Chitinophagaceae bacterium]|jgi:hypothetical protein|nr:RagB/SusD family nutrient uptake outer membrane protein [Chitinophagaceae bacterium]
MNTKKYIIYASLILIGSCSKFLEQKPKDFVSSSNFYTNVTQLQEALTGAYSRLQNLYNPGGWLYGVTEMVSDNTTFEYNNEDRGTLQFENIDYFQVTTDNNYLSSLWTTLYNAIAQCNGVLDHIDDIQFTDQTQKSQIAGQAKFLRGLYYFHLVRVWGSVPLTLTQVSNPSQAYTGKSSVDSIYQQIISDVSDAASSLPASWGSSDVGRVTSGAAYTLLGELYLTQKNYAQAISSFKNVTGYSLLPNYADLYNPANKNNVESIMEVQFSAAIQGQASNFLYDWAPLYSGFATIGSFDPNSGAGRNIPTRDMIAAYEPNDKRKDASIAWFVDQLNITKGYVEAQHDSVPYINKYATKPTQSGRQDNDFYIYRYSEVLLWWAEAINESSGPTAEAYGYVNSVRARAGLPNMASGLNQSDFRNALFKEERVEEAFENHRWYQLLRTGTAIDIMTQNGIEQRAYQTWLPPNSYNIQAYELLFPIPLNEVLLNNIAQNPGWQ